MCALPWGKDHFVQQALLAAIVESSEDAIVSKTLEGRILSWNSAASRIFGYLAEDIIGQSIMTIIPPELHDEERMILEKIRRGERVQHFDTIRVTKDGRRIPISLTYLLFAMHADALWVHRKWAGTSRSANEMRRGFVSVSKTLWRRTGTRMSSSLKLPMRCVTLWHLFSMRSP